MMRTWQVGAARITRITEYFAPTSAPAFLFAAVPAAERDAALAANAGWLAPDYYIPGIDRLVTAIQFWLVQAGGNTILIDTGVGNRKPRPAPGMDMLNTPALAWLQAAGAPPEAVTHVVHTHLHADHVGWNTVWREGRWEPTFPNATYLIPAEEYKHWRAAFDTGDAGVNGGSFADSVVPVVDAGLSRLFEGNAELAGCLVPEPVPGHAPGMVSYRLRSDGQEVLFAADTMHNPIQVQFPHWNDRYCLDPAQALRSRAVVLERAAQRQALLMPFHFAGPSCGTVRREGDGFRFEPYAG